MRELRARRREAADMRADGDTLLGLFGELSPDDQVDLAVDVLTGHV